MIISSNTAIHPVAKNNQCEFAVINSIFHPNAELRGQVSLFSWSQCVRIFCKYGLSGLLEALFIFITKCLPGMFFNCFFSFIDVMI